MKEFIAVDDGTVSSQIVQTKAARSLRVTCYGSSSAKTPEHFLKEARSLGYILAKRGHICVNGAGSFGCMSALNEGACQGDGHIIGVIHEMFLVDGGDWVDRDGGAHKVFDKDNISGKDSSGPLREILVAGGADLQERKRLLVDNADGLIVLPGGPGTWDELWEMACSRHLGLTPLPIVCVNVNKYYEPFRQMLKNAYETDLIKLRPEQIVHFVSSSEEAVVWLEKELSGTATPGMKIPTIKRRLTDLKRGSFLSEPMTGSSKLNQTKKSSLHETSAQNPTTNAINWMQVGMSLTIGITLGMIVMSPSKRNHA